MRKRVLLLSTCFRPNVGGVETHLDDLIKEGSQKGLKFIVVTYQPLVTNAKGAFIERDSTSSIYRIPWLRMNLFLHLEKYPILEFFYLFPGIFSASLIFMIFKNKGVGTIHAQGISSGVVALILSKIFNKKFVISTHSIYHFPLKGFYTRFVRFLFNSSNHVLTLSRQSKKELERIGVTKNKTSVFTYWVDQEVFMPENSAKTRKKLKLSKSDFICLFVGRLVPKKGIEELLEAAKLTSEKIKFLIVGDGPLQREISNIKYQISNIIFLGRIENDKLPSYYNAVDVLIVPSTHEEGFGRVILEALSCGLPVIGSNRGAIPEAMNEKVGVFINVTPENIKNTLENLAENTEILQTMRKYARVFAEEKYSPRNIDLITKYYET